MRYYLVRGTIRKSRYMVDEVEEFDDIRLVVADSPGEAERKFDAFWNAKSEDYGVRYWASGDCIETIE